MTDPGAGFLITVGALGGWLLSKIGDAVFQAIVGGIGKVEFVRTWCAFTCNVDHPERELIRSQYDPRRVLTDAPVHPLVIEGDFVNHRSTTVILRSPKLWFEHPDHDPFTFSNPVMEVAGVTSAVLSIPGETALRVRLTIDVPPSMVPKFEGVLPVLELQRASGGRTRFRLSSGSFLGPTFAVWPRKGSRPIRIEAA